VMKPVAAGSATPASSPIPPPTNEQRAPLPAEKAPKVTSKKATSAPKSLASKPIADIDDGTADRK
jgi:hypothetical protein